MTTTRCTVPTSYWTISLNGGFGRVRDHFSEETGYDDTADFLDGVDGAFDGFLSITAEYWTDYTDADAPNRIPPVEANVGTYVQALYDTLAAADEETRLDIVTAREDCRDAMQTWLRDHGIRAGDAYDDFRISDDKHELPYTVYIDDNPYLATALDADAHQDDLMVVFDRPYNRDVDTTHVRVSSIADVPRYL
jgi:hypothetical protein